MVDLAYLFVFSNGSLSIRARKKLAARDHPDADLHLPNVHAANLLVSYVVFHGLRRVRVELAHRNVSGVAVPASRLLRGDREYRHGSGEHGLAGDVASAHGVPSFVVRTNCLNFVGPVWTTPCWTILAQE